MTSFPPYPANFEGQLRWYAAFGEILDGYINAIIHEYACYRIYPTSSSLKVALSAITEIHVKANNWLAMATNLVNSHELRDPTITTEPLLCWLRQMAIDFQPKMEYVDSIYTDIKSIRFN